MTLPDGRVEARPHCVVYGEYPPFRNPAAAATLATVRALLADGRTVEVVSPRPSAAHHHADLGKSTGAASFARRLVGGADVVAFLDSGMLTSGGRRAAATRAILGLAVRRAGTVEVHLSPLRVSPDPRWARAILGPADRVVVASAADGAILAGLGVPAGRIVEETGAGPEVDDPVPFEGAGGEGDVRSRSEPWSLGTRPGRDEIEAEIRRRAEKDRAAESTSTVAPSWPLHLLTPLHPAPVHATKPLFRLVKQVVHRLVGWEIVPIVEQVNHLQRATIEAVDRCTVPAQPDGSGERGDSVATSS